MRSPPELLVRALGRPLERRHPLRPVDAIAVPGVPATPSGQLSRVGRERVEAAAALWHRGLAPRLIISGGAPGGGPCEAAVMAHGAEALGVPRSAIIQERRALNTRDNALLSAALLAPLGASSVVVVTQPFHLRRAVFWYRRAGLEALGHSVDDSVQFRYPADGLRWVVREYGSWLVLGVRDLAGLRR